MNYLEIAGTIIGLLYLYLEYKANAWLWAASIAMPALYLFVYYDAGLYADFGISVYYILASLYGLVCWLKGSSKGEQGGDSNSIVRTPKAAWLPLTAISAVLFFLIGFVLSDFTDSNVPWADAFTTALSIIALWMLARKYVEQWLVWIIVDVASAILYVYKDLLFTAGLYLLYAVIAVLGYRKWKKMMK